MTYSIALPTAGAYLSVFYALAPYSAVLAQHAYPRGSVCDALVAPYSCSNTPIPSDKHTSATVKTIAHANALYPL